MKHFVATQAYILFSMYLHKKLHRYWYHIAYTYTCLWYTHIYRALYPYNVILCVYSHLSQLEMKWCTNGRISMAYK